MRVRTTSFSFISLFLFPVLLSLPYSSPHLSHHDSVNGTIPPRTLDSILQGCAFKAFSRPKTGVPYDSQPPKNLSGVRVSALRLRSGSLRNRGFQSYKEFQIPIGVVEQPYVERLVLAYHNLGNWSEIFYPLPGYTYLTPVLGLLAYNGANISAQELPELDIRASNDPILVNFKDVKPAPFGSVAKCVYFDLHGSVEFDKLLNGNACSTVQQGHFSIVVESVVSAPSSAPAPAPAAFAANVGKHHGWDMSKVWIVVASLVGGCIILILLSLLVARVRRTNNKMRIQQLEWAAESNETLNMASIGGTKAPSAFGTRTRPTIETDYIP